jgi:UDP-N-acetyl-2-amino-2-deoxyglucuronate dehydrogenase
LYSFAIIGCGKISWRHAALIAERGKLAAVCDIDKTRADEMADKFSAKAYYNAGEMFTIEKDLQVVSVCSPSGLHAQHSVLSLKNGCHVICEKPMAITSADCDWMMQAAKEADRHLFIVKQNRYNPPIVALHELTAKGKLGRILSVQLNCFWNRGPEYYKQSWRGDKELAGGTLYTQFSHFIDLLCWLFGSPKVVSAVSKNLLHQGVSEIDDEGVVLLEWENGAIGSIHYTVNSFSKNMEGSITVFGEHGTVKVGGEYLNTLEYQQIDDYVIPALNKGNLANQYGGYSGSMSNHDKVYDNVLAVLAGKEKVATSGLEGKSTVQLIEKIYNN